MTSLPEEIPLQPKKTEIHGYSTNNYDKSFSEPDCISIQNEETATFGEPAKKNEIVIKNENNKEMDSCNIPQYRKTSEHKEQYMDFGSLKKNVEKETGPAEDSFFKKPSLLSKILKTIAIDAAYFGAALSLGIIGPSLIDLEAQTDSSGAEIANIFTLRGVLAIFGSLALAPILEKFNRYMSVGISLFFTGLFTLLAPLSRSLPAILLTLGPPEFFGCALGMGTHLLCVEIWCGDAGPFLQLLNFVSITGFAVAPLIVKPFLSETTISSNTSVTDLCQTVGSYLVDMNVLASNASENSNYTLIDGPSVQPCLEANNSIASDVRMNGKSYVYFAYIIVGIYCLLAAIIFVMIIYFDTASRGLVRKIMPLDDQNKSNHNYSNAYLIFLYSLFYLLILFYGGIEVGFCGLVPTFAVRELKWSKGNGALLVTVVQGFNAFFTAIGICLSYFIRPKVIILVDVIIVVVSLILLDLFVGSYPNILWFCSALLGIGSASIMPSAYTWANDLFEITGTFNGFFWCGFFSGFMIMPAIAGALMEALNHMWFCHVFLICGTLVVLLFLCLLCSVNQKSTKPKTDESVEKSLKPDV